MPTPGISEDRDPMKHTPWNMQTVEGFDGSFRFLRLRVPLNPTPWNLQKLEGLGVSFRFL